MRASGKLMALIVHPEDAEGEHRIHRRLRFLRIDAEHGKRAIVLSAGPRGYKPG